jgi:hypothetical protein
MRFRSYDQDTEGSILSFPRVESASDGGRKNCRQRLRHYGSNAGCVGDLDFGDSKIDVNRLLPHIDIVQRDNKNGDTRERKKESCPTGKWSYTRT